MHGKAWLWGAVVSGVIGCGNGAALAPEALAGPIGTGNAGMPAMGGGAQARMAYLGIGHPSAQAMFLDRRDDLNFANLEPAGNASFSIRTNRRPMYGGANIIPLEGTGEVAVEVTNLGNGLQGSDFVATLSIRAATGAVRYVVLPEGTGTATVASDEEASLVVVNTPDQLYQYDAFQTAASSPESAGLNYRVRITGAVPANRRARTLQNS
jgi:hypothetical protein